MADRPSILVVEDDRDTADMLKAYFEAQGYQIYWASWGADALRLTQEALPDLIVLDIRLPDIDGYEVCRQLRAQRRTGSVPIIFLTERRERIDRLSGLELGAVDYITKPFDIQELRLRVRNALKRSRFETLVDPITGLASLPLIDEKLTALLDQPGWAVVCVAVAGLDKFGDAYGFVARDDALRALALVLSNTTFEGGVDPDASFVGQLEEDNFLIVVESGRSQELRDRLILRLKQAINYFYPAKERQTESSQRPMLRLSLGVVTAADGKFESADAVKDAVKQALAPL
ncbi:MAG TPA: response regulator [Anaerolineae bacterium]|nr:response regulator [Anaerolineae bacterium]